MIGVILFQRIGPESYPEIHYGWTTEEELNKAYEQYKSRPDLYYNPEKFTDIHTALNRFSERTVGTRKPTRRELLAPPFYGICGYVRDEKGNPIEGAKVTIQEQRESPFGGTMWYSRRSYLTHPDGYYEISAAPGYTYRLVVEKEGYKSATYVIGPTSNLVEVVSSNERVNLDVTLDRHDFTLESIEKHNRIYGTVTDKALGTPVAYATITFGSKTAITGNDGKYEIKDVWYSGEIVCQAPGYKPATKIIEAPEEGDLEVNFELERAEQPVTDVTPLVPPLQGIDAALKGYYESWQNFARNVLNIEEKDGVLTAGVGNPLGLIQQGFEKLKEALQDAIGEMPEQQKRSLQLKELLRLYTKGLLPKEVAEPQIIAIYEYFGLTEEDARKMMLSYFKSLTTSQIEGLFKKGLIDEAKAKEKLMRNEYTEEDAELIISLWKAEEEEKTKEEVKELNRSLLDRLFIADLISEDDYRNKLRELGYTDEDIDLLVNLAKTKKEVRVEEPKVLSKSDVLKAYREELIDEETAKKKLKELNYTDEDIELLLNMSAREKLGKLRVTSKPTRAMIIINDNPINLLTPETIELAPGNYSVTVSMEGYKTPEPKDVVIEEEGRTEVHFDLERMKIGYLTIRSRPSQAAIYINGVDTKLLTPQTFELEEGKYTITLKYRGYKDKEFEVEIKEGETVEKFLRLTRE